MVRFYFCKSLLKSIPRQNIPNLQTSQLLTEPGAEADLQRCVDRPHAAGEDEAAESDPEGPRTGADRPAVCRSVYFLLRIILLFSNTHSGQ